MNSIRHLLFKILPAILVLLGPGLSRAQQNQDQKDLPTPPYVAPVPDFFQWTITCADKPASGAPVAKPDAQQPPAFAVQKVECTKTRNIKRDIIYYTTGKKTELWYDGGMVIFTTPDGGVAINSAGGVLAQFFTPDISVPGFAGVDWITLSNFVAKKPSTITGNPVFYYNGTVHSQTSAMAASMENFKHQNQPAVSGPGTPVTATIDVKSRLPITVEKEGRVWTYSYQTAPTQMLELPVAAQKQLSALKARQIMMDKMNQIH